MKLTNNEINGTFLKGDEAEFWEQLNKEYLSEVNNNEAYQKFEARFNREQDEKYRGKVEALEEEFPLQERILAIEQMNARKQLEKDLTALEEYELKQSKANDNLIETVTIKQLLKQTFPQDIWLIEGLIPKFGFTAITGTPATFKSFITEHLAVAIAGGNKLFNHFEASKGAVLIIDKENAPSILKSRFQLLGVKEDDGLEIYFLKEPDKFNLSDENHYNFLVKEVEQKQIKLLIVDSFVHLHKGDENTAGEIAKTFERLKPLNCAKVIIMHHRKVIKFLSSSVLESIRGSSDIGAELESHLAVEKLSGLIKITQGKNRNGKLANSFLITPTITDSSANFEYLKEIEEEVSKIEQAKQLIISALKMNKTMNRHQLIEHLLGKVGGTNIDKGLKQLIELSEVIAVNEGKFKYYYYSHNPQP